MGPRGEPKPFADNDAPASGMWLADCLNRALWKKSLLETAPSALAASLVLFAFSWLYIWLMSHLNTEVWSGLLNFMPQFIQPILSVPLQDLTTAVGKNSLLFVDGVTVFTSVAWAISRGSDAVSGELSRGTMELLLAQPLRRTALLAVQALVTTLGSLLMACGLLLGTCLGLLTVHPDLTPDLLRYAPAVLNVFAMTFCLTGITTLISACDSERWRTIGFACGFFIVSLLIKLVARFWPPGAWLIYCTFLGGFNPHQLVLKPDQVWMLTWQFNAPLLGLGLLGYFAAAVVFSRRDLPPPL